MAKKEYLSDRVWYGDLKGTIAFDIGELELSLDKLEVEGRELLSKTEFHCSLIAARKYAEQSIDDPGQAKQLEAEIVATVREYVAAYPLKFVGLTGDYYLCEEDQEATIIGLVDINGVNELLRKVANATGVEIDTPKLHVTLYKNESSPYGIGIRNTEDFTKLCRELPPKVLEALRENTPLSKA